VRYQHRTNPRLVAYSNGQARAVAGKPHREPFVYVTVHALGRPGDRAAGEFTRSLFHRVYRLDLTKR
jgi:hypothetical protein